ncbi:MAG: DUF1549 domain-containing protein [Gemmataceae bacterium]
MTSPPSSRCSPGTVVNCHGPNRQKAGLRLDSGVGVRKGDDGGAVVVPGKPDESRLLHAVRGTGEGERMPLDAPPLSAEQIDTLKAWIVQGATVPKDEPRPASASDHWAFQPPAKVTPPPGEANPVDAFLAAERTKRGLTAAPEAPPEVLLRRVTFDLTGLPPTDAELVAFLADRSPDAYERAVDRLLASPRHGERWGRHWLDIWRYADWYGFGGERRRNSQKHLAVAGLGGREPERRRRLRPHGPADAGRRRGRPGRPGRPAGDRFPGPQLLQVQPERLARQHRRAHRQRRCSGTLNCAKCHDHMYDPVSQEEYYRFRPSSSRTRCGWTVCPAQPIRKWAGWPACSTPTLPSRRTCSSGATTNGR